ncbi:MAG: helix-turn-helix domain-containing protein [Planctomycetota bacterium]|nr:helix-turn-helix domain-containing protein [Planctomycetota bacterium]MDA1178100.1 helix-turn-helix domain-containing protein [Planctomycetota bacterium]
MTNWSLETRDTLQSAISHEARARRSAQRQQTAAGTDYLVTLGRKAVVVDGIEFRILRFLASQPYRAFTPDRIVAAVTTPQEPVTSETLRAYILSLRDKLGMFSDYVQSVPYVGYRFRQ